MGYREEYWKQYAISRLLVSVSKLTMALIQVLEWPLILFW
jgi:hypothetical protein